MNLKKKLAGAMAFAMAVTTLPGSVSAVPDTVEAAAETISLPAAKYELSLDGNLNSEGQAGGSAILVSAGRVAAEGEGTFVEGYSGQAFSTGGTQGVELKDVAVDETYTVSVWANLPAAQGFR